MVPGHPGVMQPGEVLHLRDEKLDENIGSNKICGMG